MAEVPDTPSISTVKTVKYLLSPKGRIAWKLVLHIHHGSFSLWHDGIGSVTLGHLTTHVALCGTLPLRSPLHATPPLRLFGYLHPLG